jgi:transcriptional regulator with XRE-family HTH domain
VDTAKTKRKRGVFISNIGYHKLKAARSQCECERNFGNRYTIEQLSEMAGLASNTINKIFNGNISLDRSTIERCFSSFGLILDSDDYQDRPITVSSFNPTIAQPNPSTIATLLEFPDGSVALDSPFYVERPSIESDCYQEILKPGSLIRIRGPRQTGKTSLLNRILAYAVQNTYQVVRLNLRQADKSIFTDLNKLLRWFCLNVSRQLNLTPNLDEYWDEEIGSKVSCTVYFQSHILEQLNTNLVISIDEVDAVFNYPDLAEDFLALLREWHEEATIEQSWRKLRLAISHSTEVYIPLNIHQSPFNVGLPLRLPQFNPQQVQNLAQLHCLIWTMADTHQLIAMLGGHPYLIRLALYHLARQDITLEQLLQSAPTHAGVYSDHLRRCLGNVKQQPELASALKQVVSAQTPVQLPPAIVYQLDSMGLVSLDGNRISPSCELYRQYFNVNL